MTSIDIDPKKFKYLATLVGLNTKEMRVLADRAIAAGLNIRVTVSLSQES